MKTLKGRQVATIHNNVAYDQRTGCRAPGSYTVNVNLTRVERASGFCPGMCVYRPGGCELHAGWGVRTHDGPPELQCHPHPTIAPGQSFNLCSEFAEVAGCMPFGYPGAVNGNLNNMKSIGDGSTVTFTPTVNALGATGKFTYRVTKRANYL
ncbi:MAG: hypothetical protein IPK85_01030 [Gemmatimonadetes bacterium]|nr:hypothetical protein [Gemmatimonadota bacterium]